MTDTDRFNHDSVKTGCFTDYNCFPGSPRDATTAAGEIVLRAREAVADIPVPNETRQALDDGTTGFERILPGADRMYPDTDLPPMAVGDGRIDRIRSAGL